MTSDNRRWSGHPLLLTGHLKDSGSTETQIKLPENQVLGEEGVDLPAFFKEEGIDVFSAMETEKPPGG